jgi:GTPase SAR1 family protein
MIKVDELELGSNDAEDYKRKDYKDFFNTVFFKNTSLERLLTLKTFFLIGDKGTGKTAYAVYLSNNEYKETRSKISYIRETEYQKFVNLKIEKKLVLSDYATIWKVIILVLLASDIKKDNISSPFSKNEKLEKIKEAISYYFNNAFDPELLQAIQIVESSSEIASLIFKAINLQNKESAQVTYNETKIQNNLLFIEKNLISSLMELKLNLNQFLFIDGIDIRPIGIEYREYLMCIKGLAEAIWSLNNDVFSLSNGSRGRFKAVLLLRPDIFQSIGLQNSTNKIMNNTVLLDWRTTYTNYHESELYKISDRLLLYKQKDEEIKSLSTTIWDYYFNWTTPSTNDSRDYDTPFIDFLRISYSRPRDFVTIVQLIRNIQKQKNLANIIFLKKYLIVQNSKMHIHNI